MEAVYGVLASRYPTRSRKAALHHQFCRGFVVLLSRVVGEQRVPYRRLRCACGGGVRDGHVRDGQVRGSRRGSLAEDIASWTATTAVTRRKYGPPRRAVGSSCG